VRDPWWESLSGTGDYLTVLDETFDHPVTVAATECATVDASLTQIIVSIIASAAVIVLIRYWPIAIVAVNGI